MKIAVVGADDGAVGGGEAALRAAGALWISGADAAAVEAFRAEHGLAHAEESRLDPAEVPAEVVRSIARMHYYESEAVLLVSSGAATFTVDVGDDRAVSVELGAGDLLFLPPRVRHGMVVVESPLCCTGLSTYDPAKHEPEMKF